MRKLVLLIIPVALLLSACWRPTATRADGTAVRWLCSPTDPIKFSSRGSESYRQELREEVWAIHVWTGHNFEEVSNTDWSADITFSEADVADRIDHNGVWFYSAFLAQWGFDRRHQMKRDLARVMGVGGGDWSVHTGAANYTQDDITGLAAVGC